MVMTAMMFELGDFKQYGIVWAQQWPNPPANVTGMLTLILVYLVNSQVFI